MQTQLVQAGAAHQGVQLWHGTFLKQFVSGMVRMLADDLKVHSPAALFDPARLDSHFLVTQAVAEAALHTKNSASAIADELQMATQPEPLEQIAHMKSGDLLKSDNVRLMSAMHVLYESYIVPHFQDLTLHLPWTEEELINLIQYEINVCIKGHVTPDHPSLE